MYSLPSKAKIAGVSFKLNRVQAGNVTRGGQFQGVDLAEPLWVAELETTPLSRAQAGEYDALLTKLRGVMRTIEVYNASRPRPIAYHSAADATGVRIGVTTRRIGVTTRRIGLAEHPWGAPSIVQYDRANGRVLLRGLRASATLSPGDYGHWDDGPARRLAMVVEAASADANGEVWATIEPVPPAAATGAFPLSFQMHKASAEMVVLRSTMPFSPAERWSVTLTAAQVLRKF